MKEKRSPEKFVQSLLLVLPEWHSKLVRPFKEMLNKEMSLETYYCLQTLKACGTMTMTELAQHLKVPKQQATKLVDKLHACQFIERVYQDNDRRAIWIRLTERAVIYLDEYYLKNTEFIHSLEEQLTANELEELCSAVETFQRILPKLK